MQNVSDICETLLDLIIENIRDFLCLRIGACLTGHIQSVSQMNSDAEIWTKPCAWGSDDILFRILSADNMRCARYQKAGGNQSREVGHEES